jgi:hydroxymethylglutaryl-CoA lyase
VSESPGDAAPRTGVVEVGPRDGFQSVAVNIPTDQKLHMIRRLYAAGVRRMEVSSFVSDRVVWAPENMGVEKGIDLSSLLVATQLAEGLPGAQVGGRVRAALAAASGFRNHAA